MAGFSDIPGKIRLTISKAQFLKKVSLSCIHNILMIHSSNSGSNAELSLFSDIFTVIYKLVGTHDVLQAVH